MRFAGPKRFQRVPVTIEQLPELDAVILSHDHYDHLCRESMIALAKKQIPIITSLGVGARLEAWGIPADQFVELDWWESTSGVGFEVTATPSQHFSGRSLNDRNRTLWSSMVIRTERHTVFFSGDTGLTQEYVSIGERFGPFDLVMLEIGAYHESWGTVHLGPDGALEAHRLLGGGPLLPVHWGTFDLAMHDWDQPAERLLELGRDIPLLMPKLGAPTEPAQFDGPTPWWREVLAVQGAPVARQA